MPLWFILIAIGVATFLFKAAFPLFSRGWTLPPTLDRALRLAPPAVLSALVWVALFLPAGPPLRLSLNDRLLAGMLAAGVALAILKVKRLLPFFLLLVVAVGMVSLWLLQRIH
jgi:branched-subunit amino acid transport protein